MAAVDDADHVTAGDLREHGGDEALAHLVSGQAGGPAIHAGLRPAGDGGEVGFVVGGLAEGAEEGGGRLDGGESLAADVADDDAESVRGGDGLVQVTADTCFRCGGQVEGFDQKGADAVRDRAQQDMLRDLGHEAHVGEGAFPAHAVGSQERSEDADHGGAQVGGHVVALPDVAHRAARAARGAGQDSFEDDREHGDAGDGSGAVGEGCDHGEGDEQEAHRPFHGRNGFEHQDARDIEGGQPPHPHGRGRHLRAPVAGRHGPATRRPGAARPPHSHSVTERAARARTPSSRRTEPSCGPRPACGHCSWRLHSDSLYTRDSWHMMWARRPSCCPATPRAVHCSSQWHVRTSVWVPCALHRVRDDHAAAVSGRRDAWRVPSGAGARHTRRDPHRLPRRHRPRSRGDGPGPPHRPAGHRYRHLSPGAPPPEAAAHHRRRDVVEACAGA